ncbi:ATP-binding cassette domain-containing protein [Rhizobium lusitanum]|uniref:ATP-binding cassette domain-containing protein n=1 Tax=Rhizobium lusitanum TaxID=293958 RepID=A0A6L9U170_9HYPH|nr:amino acid ABC transporter ATP-binding protein [Rhizobium lusitanum]NEI69249.1 ATP-binding cassette domain-containing protein [Rhizobium lusitanum]
MSEAAPPLIRIARVSKRFGSVAVLNDLDLEVRPFENLSLIGPSGAGKSMVLRILMTLEKIDEGSVTIDGLNLWGDGGVGRASVPASANDIKAVRRRVGMVFQSLNLFPHMSALRNVAEAPVRVLKLPKEEAYARAAELLDRVGLGAKQGSYPTELSGGQQQRVAIARALAMRPKILLFDEVTSALDPETVGEVLGVIREVARGHSLTTISVTHQLKLAGEISDRICFLESGRIVEEGPPDQILYAPVNGRTRAFVEALL